MPRIRTLKPEHRTHRKVGALDDRTYRLWVGLLCEADDQGRLVCDAEQLRVIIFGYQLKVTAAMIEQGLARLVAVGLLRCYDAGGVRYAVFPSWREHQRISHDSPSKLPDPGESVDVPEPSGILQSLPEDYGLIKDQGSRIKEGIKDQGEEAAKAPAPAPAPPSPRPRAVASLAQNGPAPPLPDRIRLALERCPRLAGRFPTSPMWTQAWWTAEIRATHVDVVAELAKAEAWCASNPDRSPKSRPAQFLHRWFGRAKDDEATP